MQANISILKLLIPLSIILGLSILSCGKSSSIQTDAHSAPPIYPESKETEVFDTLVTSKGSEYHIFFKRFTIDDSFVEQTHQYENHIETVLFRNWAVALDLNKDGSQMLHDTLTKESFMHIIQDSLFLNQSIIHSFWLEEVKTNPIFMSVIGIPESDNVLVFEVELKGSKMDILEFVE